LKFQKRIHFLKKIIIHVVNVEIDRMEVGKEIIKSNFSKPLKRFFGVQIERCMDTNQKPNLIHQWGNSILLTWLKKANCIGIWLSSNKGNKSGITILQRQQNLRTKSWDSLKPKPRSIIKMQDGTMPK